MNNVSTTTHWTTQINPAREGSISALAKLYTRYRPIMRAYIGLWRSGQRRLEPEDLLHDFFIGKFPSVLADADRTRGRFRNLLLAAMRHFLLERVRKDAAQKRGLMVTGEFIEEPAALSNPELEYLYAWVRVVRERAIRTLQDQVLSSANSVDARLLEHVQADLMEGERAEFRHDAGLLDELGLSAGATKKRVQRLRDRYYTLVRREIGETLTAAAGTEA